MGSDNDWNDYLEPEVDGPDIYVAYRCPKCGYKEVIPETVYQARPNTLTVVCPKCKIQMHEDTER